MRGYNLMVKKLSTATVANLNAQIVLLDMINICQITLTEQT